MNRCQCVTANVKAITLFALTHKTTILRAISVRVTAVTAEMFTYRFQFIFHSNYFFSKNNRDFSLDNVTKYFKAPFYGVLDCLVKTKTALTSAVTKRGAQK